MGIAFDTIHTFNVIKKTQCCKIHSSYASSGNMMFEYKHRCPFCQLNSTPNTDHDHFLTCALTRDSKNKRLTSLRLKLEKLHTPPFLRDSIINAIDKYYNNGLVDDITASCSTSFKREINNCTYLHQCIGWEHFLRGRISTSFHSPINYYYRSNHLGKRFTSSFWFLPLITFLWDLHHNAWLNYCNSIHTPDKTIHIITTAKSTLLNLVDIYILEAKILPKHKRLFFACKKSQYQSWNITELQNWLSSERRILRRYRDQIVDPTKVSNTISLLSQYIVHRPPNHNHYTVSPITKYFTDNNRHIIPTSTTSLDLARQKNNEIHIPSPTIVSHIPSVRNTSPNLPTNYSSPRTNSLNHNTINSFPPTSNLLNHLPTHFQSKPIHISIPISTLQIANDHQLVTNSTIINTISVIDSKHSTKKSSTFSRNILSSPPLQHIPHILLTAKKKNHLKASPITKYY